MLAVASAAAVWTVSGGGVDVVSTPPPPSSSGLPSDSVGTAPLSGYGSVAVDGAALVPTTSWDVASAGDAVAGGHLVDIAKPLVKDPATTNVVALTDAGGLVGARSAGTGLNIGQVTVGMLTPGGVLSPFTAATPDGVDPSKARQSESFSTNGSHVAWVETPSTDLRFDNWSVFAADTNTGRTVALGSSEDVLPGDQLPIIGPYVSVTVGTDRAYWGTPYPRGERGTDGHYTDFGLKILSRALDGSGSLETAADGAILPAADGDCVVFARVHGSDPTVPDGTFRIGRVCPRQAETVVATVSLGDHGTLRALAADEGFVAWSMTDSSGDVVVRSDVDILNTRTGSLAVVQLTSRQGMEPESICGLQIHDSLVQWSTQSTRALVDLEVGTIWSLPATPGFYTLLQAGDLLGWQIGDAAGQAVVSVGRWHR